jgi:hypothetical protein
VKASTSRSASTSSFTRVYVVADIAEQWLHLVVDRLHFSVLKAPASRAA